MNICQRKLAHSSLCVQTTLVCNLYKIIVIRGSILLTDADNRAVHCALYDFSVYNTFFLIDCQLLFTYIKLTFLDLPLLFLDHFFKLF